MSNMKTLSNSMVKLCTFTHFYPIVYLLVSVFVSFVSFAVVGSFAKPFQSFQV